MPESKLPNLVVFLRSTLSPNQIGHLIELLKEGISAPITLDPEERPTARKPATVQTPTVAAPAGLDGILTEMSEAYSEAKFPSPSPDEARRVRDQYPGLIERLNAFQGRHLVKMLREKLKV